MTASTSTVDTPAGYSALQIALHWLIAVLVLWQLVFGESLPDAERMLRSGGTPDASLEFFATSHIWVGFAILALVAVRIALRLARPVPAHEPGPAALVAKVVHGLFYLLLAAAPLTGIADYYLGWPTGEVHELAKPAFIVLIAVHAAAALFRQFVRHDGTLTRMLLPGR